jgi:predicted PurR-regulated permease PerM
MIDTAAAWAVAWRIVFLVVAVATAIWLAIALQAILLQLLVALILATGLSPLVERLHGLGMSRGGSVLMIYLLFLIALGSLGWAIIPPIVDQAGSLVVAAPRFDDRAFELHPLAVIVAIMVGGELLGVVGAIVSVPVAAALAVVLDELRYREGTDRPLAERVETDTGARPVEASAAQAAKPPERKERGGQPGAVADRVVPPARDQPGRRHRGDRRAD